LKKTLSGKRAYVFCQQAIPKTLDRVLKNAISGIDFQTMLFLPSMSLCFNRKKD